MLTNQDEMMYKLRKELQKKEDLLKEKESKDENRTLVFEKMQAETAKNAVQWVLNIALENVKELEALVENQKQLNATLSQSLADKEILLSIAQREAEMAKIIGLDSIGIDHKLQLVKNTERPRDLIQHQPVTDAQGKYSMLPIEKPLLFSSPFTHSASEAIDSNLQELQSNPYQNDIVYEQYDKYSLSYTNNPDNKSKKNKKRKRGS